MTQQATSTTTVRLVEAFQNNERDGDHPEVFEDGTSNRIYQTLDGYQTVATSWTGTDENFPENAVAWPATNEHGEPTVEFFFSHLLTTGDVPHADGPDTDETHEAVLAQIGFSVERQEEAA